MVNKLFKVFGDSNEKAVKRLGWIVDRVNGLEPQFSALSDDALRAKTGEFRDRFGRGESLDDLAPEAFAAVREAAKRQLNMRHFDVQLIGGLVLHQGKVAEMKTGEGKTLVATLPLYLNALSGNGAHLVTVNDYLARRDARWMGAVYHALDLSVGCLQHESSYLYEPDAPTDSSTPEEMRPVARNEAYAADITYGTNNEFGFDYLRDNMAGALDRQVQGELAYAIVDEVDNILIDEARTPLIISGPAQESTSDYKRYAALAPRLNEGADFKIEYKERHVVLTEQGIEKVERMLNVDNLYDPANDELIHFVENALRAEFAYLRDRDYVVQSGEVIIVDEFTGRLMPGRRYADGLHQALEAKERVEVQRATITYATITLQNYFRMYRKLAGMTGTAITEAEEFYKVYQLDVIAIPTNMPVVREDYADLIFKTEHAKFDAVLHDIVEQHDAGRPILVGTASIEKSETLSESLRRRGISHQVLNAKNHEREAQIVAQAGQPGAVTVSTNMAGRGTDIILGGAPASYDSGSEWSDAHQRVLDLGGLYVIGTERHESRRIDNQLRGRSGRQGDPGATRFYGSLEDDLIKHFGDGATGRLVTAALPDDTPLESGLLTRTMEMTQSKVEARYFDIRKHLVEYDDVVNTQRAVIYAERKKVLEGGDVKANIQEMLASETQALIRTHLAGDPNDWDADMLLAQMGVVLPLPGWLDADFVFGHSAAETEGALLDLADQEYARREEEFGAETMRALERVVLLQTTDRLWVQHLTQMSNLRQGIGLYAYGQRDPLVMYKKQGHELFDVLRERIRHDIVHTIFRVAPAGHVPPQRASNGKSAGVRVGRGAARVATAGPETILSQIAGNPNATPTQTKKLGRNEPCWCGSGKKFKRCHGAAA